MRWIITILAFGLLLSGCGGNTTEITEPSQAAAPNDPATADPGDPDPADPEPQLSPPGSTHVTFTGNGFVPSTLTGVVGQEITVKNDDSGELILQGADVSVIVGAGESATVTPSAGVIKDPLTGQTLTIS